MVGGREVHQGLVPAGRMQFERARTETCQLTGPCGGGGQIPKFIADFDGKIRGVLGFS